MRFTSISTALILSLIGCNTPCQQVCIRMSDYAEECGISVPSGQLEACLDDQANAPDQAACARAGSASTIRSEWSCDDVAVFFE